MNVVEAVRQELGAGGAVRRELGVAQKAARKAAQQVRQTLVEAVLVRPPHLPRVNQFAPQQTAAG